MEARLDEQHVHAPVLFQHLSPPPLTPPQDQRSGPHFPPACVGDDSSPLSAHNALIRVRLCLRRRHFCLKLSRQDQICFFFAALDHIEYLGQIPNVGW